MPRTYKVWPTFQSEVIIHKGMTGDDMEEIGHGNSSDSLLTIYKEAPAPVNDDKDKGIRRTRREEHIEEHVYKMSSLKRYEWTLDSEEATA